MTDKMLIDESIAPRRSIKITRKRLEAMLAHHRLECWNSEIKDGRVSERSKRKVGKLEEQIIRRILGESNNGI
jgi:hypothetical protein